jgi:cytochrome oxidase assembly protein ShyY1
VEQQLGIALYDYQLLLDEADADGFVRRWRPALMAPERHVGYAVQWFAFAVVIGIIYFIVNMQRIRSDD